MDAPLISISSPAPQPGTWSSTAQLKIGRMTDLEVVIDDSSISRRHAEIVLGDEGWVVRDTGSTNGTYLNGVRIGRTPQRVRQTDRIRAGNIEFRIDQLRGQPAKVQVGGRSVQVAAASRRSWDEAVDGFELRDDRWQVDGKAFLRLMRGGYRLAHSTSPDEQLQKILDEAVMFFGAQRGGLFLADSVTAPLTVRCVSAPPDRPPACRTLSKTPAARAYSGRQSLLFKDCQATPELQSAESVTRGAMASIICAVLRSPEQVFGVLHLDRGPLQEPFAEADLYLADSLAAALALGVERLQMLDRQQELFLHTITALAQAVELRDLYTGDHTHRVTKYSLMLAGELGLPAEDRHRLQAATALHDIGKIGIDDQILRKPGRLSETEFAQMKTHVLRGVEIIQMVPGLAWALPVVRGHHERWDGKGYPDGLAGEQIPLLARVVSVADAFDAMTSDRPYRPGMSIAAAFVEIEDGAGRQFDPLCVEAFVRVRARIEAEQEKEVVFRQRAETTTDTISARELRRQITRDAPPAIVENPTPAPRAPIAMSSLSPTITSSPEAWLEEVAEIPGDRAAQPH